MADPKTKRRARRAKPELTVFYDGASRRWRAWIGVHRMEAEHQGVAIDWIDLSKTADAFDALGIDSAEHRRGLFVVDGDGTLHRGLDAVARIWQALPDHARLVRLCRAPPVRTLVRAARNRDRALKAFMRCARAGLRPRSGRDDGAAAAGGVREP